MKFTINLFYVFLIFMVLKLTHVVSWSWWFVTMPLWILPAVTIALVCMFILWIILVFLLAIVGSIVR